MEFASIELDDTLSLYTSSKHLGVFEVTKVALGHIQVQNKEGKYGKLKRQDDIVVLDFQGYHYIIITIIP